MEVNRYHKFLRTSAVVVTLVLLFDGGFLAPVTKELSESATHYLANSITGMSANVSPNEYNELSADLRAWEESLESREQNLSGRSIPARDFNTAVVTTEKDYSLYVLSTILFILTTLIALNYALDWARVKRLHYEREAA